MHGGHDAVALIVMNRVLWKDECKSVALCEPQIQRRLFCLWTQDRKCTLCCSLIYSENWKEETGREFILLGVVNIFRPLLFISVLVCATIHSDHVLSLSRRAVKEPILKRSVRDECPRQVRDAPQLYLNIISHV